MDYILPSRQKKKKDHMNESPTAIDLLAQRAEKTFPKKSYPRLERVEKTTKRIISIATDRCDEENSRKCHPQSQSLLFALLPKDLRREIYHHTTNGIGMNATCRLAFLETSSSTIDKTFHFTSPFSNLNAREEERMYHFLTSLTANDRRNFRGVVIYTGWKWLSHSLPGYIPLFQGLRGLILRVRKEEGWVSPDGREMEVGWLEKFLGLGFMGREVRLEVEVSERQEGMMCLGPTLEGYRDLEERVERLDLKGDGGRRKFVLLRTDLIEDDEEGLRYLKRDEDGKEWLVFVWKAVDEYEHDVEESDRSWMADARKGFNKGKGKKKLNLQARWYEKKWERQNSLLKFV